MVLFLNLFIQIYNADLLFSKKKIGHAVHLEHKYWANHIFNDRIRNVAKKLGLKKPVVLQSMLIYKNPKVGGEGMWSSNECNEKFK